MLPSASLLILSLQALLASCQDTEALGGGGSKQTSNLMGLASCGDSKLGPSIINGTEAALHAFPWIVGLVHAKAQALFCGGSVINQRFILTAAHCVKIQGKALRATDLKVLAGTNSRTLTSGQLLAVSKISFHTGYRPRKDDIAVLKLAKDLVFSEKVSPVCLPAKAGSASSVAGKSATVVGWGLQAHNDTSTRPNMLRYAVLPLMSNAECKKWHTGSDITSKHVCGGFKKGGVNSCQGDSGGPVSVEEKNGRHFQQGIVSWNIACGKDGHPSVFTRVDQYTSWILQHTK